MATTVLVDTHALLWWLTGNRRLPKRARESISDRRLSVVVSAASAWEISIKQALRKLSAPDDLLSAVRASGLSWVSVEAEDAYEAGRLPLHHRDPFDRLIIAQAMARAAEIISRDDVFDLYDVKRQWR